MVRDWSVLYVVLRDQGGRVAHRAIGRAIVEADADASFTMWALRDGIEPLASFCADSPAQAEDAKRTLADLGDVDFDDRDFDPKWFDPGACIEAIDGLLEREQHGKRSMSPALRGELELLHRTLDEARCHSCTFYLTEVRPGDDLRFAGPELKQEAG